MSQVAVNVTMDADVRDSFDSFCRGLGMSMSGVFNVFAKTVVGEKRIPFDIPEYADPFYSPENMAYLRKAAKAMDAGMGVYHELLEDPEDA